MSFKEVQDSFKIYRSELDSSISGILKLELSILMSEKFEKIGMKDQPQQDIKLPALDETTKADELTQTLRVSTINSKIDELQRRVENLQVNTAAQYKQAEIIVKDFEVIQPMLGIDKVLTIMTETSSPMNQMHKGAMSIGKSEIDRLQPE